MPVPNELTDQLLAHSVKERNYLRDEITRLRKVDEDFTDTVIEAARLRGALEQVVYKARHLPSCRAEQLILLTCKQTLEEPMPKGMRELYRTIYEQARIDHAMQDDDSDSMYDKIKALENGDHHQ